SDPTVVVQKPENHRGKPGGGERVFAAGFAPVGYGLCTTVYRQRGDLPPTETGSTIGGLQHEVCDGTLPKGRSSDVE
ncbi:MAG: hypothetical protein U0936_16470, partial [Planctomycetaceae bacterium]